jgi:hypothetical protein
MQVAEGVEEAADAEIVVVDAIIEKICEAVKLIETKLYLSE